jgi:hypothetical protein
MTCQQLIDPPRDHTVIFAAIPEPAASAWTEVLALTQSPFLAHEVPVALALAIGAATLGTHMRNNWLRTNDAIVADRRTAEKTGIEVTR